MAYAAVISLKQTIERIRNSCRSSIDFPSQEILKSAYEEVKSLQKVVERWDSSSRISRESIKVLEGRMSEAACRLEDAIESHVSKCFLSQSESHPMKFSLDLQDLERDVHSFVKTAKKMEEEYIQELDNPLPPEEGDDDDDDAAVPSTPDFGGNKSSEMVGLSDLFYEVRDRILDCGLIKNVSIAGMAGVGKTTLAKKIFEDPSITRRFEHRVWVTVGRKCQSKEILQAILAEVNPRSNRRLIRDDEYILYDYLLFYLSRGSYLIVLDDVWETDFWADFRRKLPYTYVMLVTTRLGEVATSVNQFGTYNMRFMNKEESWDLLHRKVFVEEACPPQLEKAGKKIAENCEGLPLLIITVANLLSKAEKTSKYWNDVAAGKENSVFKAAYDQIYKVLYPSYNYLPQYLKACFLYMAAFPQNCEVRRSKLINLWSAEGFLVPYTSQTLQNFAVKCFEKLVSSNLVVVCQRTLYGNRVKVCSIHSVYWYLCKKEAGNIKFLHTLNSFADRVTKDIGSQSRLSIYKNILFGVKNVCNSMASISTARSLLCTGPYHQYQVPICSGLRLLRVLDALTIRFYEFPVEVLKLAMLRYLALTYNGDLPHSISKLWNLEYLIVHQHLSINSTLAKLYLPVEIWDLQELKHLQIMGRNLPDPPPGTVLPKLLTLLDVGAHSCTKSVLRSIPNLSKLRVQIELAPVAAKPPSCFDHISHLYELKSLQCVVVNPKLRSEVVPQPPRLSVSTSGLRKLTLSGYGYSWKDIEKIAELPVLEVLKLQCHAFRGEKWEADDRGFLRLKYLSIEDTDLVQWTVRTRTFPFLRYLSIKNCYKLQKIPYISSRPKIELVDCNHSAVTSAKQDSRFNVNSKRAYANAGRFYAYSSWDDGNLKL